MSLTYYILRLLLITTVICFHSLAKDNGPEGIQEEQCTKWQYLKFENKLHGYKVKFDYENFHEEREMLYKFYIKEYHFDDKKDDDYCNQKHYLQKDEIGIDLYDLDEDGEKEILVMVRNPCLCGSLGCHFDIFKKSVKQLKLNWIPGFVGSDDIKILPNTTFGYHDIIFFSRAWDDSKFIDRIRDGAFIWKWNGTNYDLFRAYWDPDS